MSKQLTKAQHQRSLTPQWRAKLEETLNLSSLIVQGTAKLAQKEMNLTLVETIGRPILKDVFKDNGTLAFSVVRVLVTRFLDSFAFTTKLSPAQIDSLTVDTLDKFSHESLEDVLLFFKKARSGEFGTTKRGVDGNLIFGDWFPKYLEEKSKQREQLIIEAKELRKSKENAERMKDVHVTYREAMLRRFKQNQKEYIDHFTRNMDRQMLEDTIVSWSKDEKLCKLVPLLKQKRKTIIK